MVGSLIFDGSNKENVSLFRRACQFSPDSILLSSDRQIRASFLDCRQNIVIASEAKQSDLKGHRERSVAIPWNSMRSPRLPSEAL
jgi:hypothetical protein